ncbi:MAG TPA: 2-C-methyl-D-erythritol 4-phosphate cytidylyltransferase [Acidimicrobiales bacterium]|nr:2-C-methyl-D-erythritol 4-phosphate cytidylyltransferase [Acidimicrobiales bacterium]
MGSVWVIVVAAGSGSRFGRPKQYEALGGRRVLDWSLDAARAVADGIVLVVPADRLVMPEPAADAVVAGGATRSSSVRAGLASVPADAEVLLVHDGARPLAGAALFSAGVAAVRAGAEAVVPAVAVTDTLRHRSGGLVPRDDLVAVQTPQAFRAATLRAAHVGEPEATDDASLVEAAGGMVVLVDGSPGNIKITHPLDLVVAGAVLAAGAAP